MSSADHPLIHILTSNYLPVLFKEGGLNPADVKIMRHVSHDFNEKIKTQINRYPILFDKYCRTCNYFLKSFENRPEYTTFVFEFGYKTPADLINSGIEIKYETSIPPLDTFISFYNFVILDVIKKNKILFVDEQSTHDSLLFLDEFLKSLNSSSYFQEEPDAKYIETFIKNYNCKDKLFISENETIFFLLKEKMEETAAAVFIYLEPPENYYKIDQCGYLDFSLRNGCFKFLSILSKKYKLNYLEDAIFLANADILMQNFTSNVSALDFFCKCILKQQSAQYVISKKYSSSDRIRIPQQVYFGCSKNYKVKNEDISLFIYKSFIHSDVSILIYLYKIFNSVSISVQLFSLLDLNINLTIVQQKICYSLYKLIPSFEYSIIGGLVGGDNKFLFIAAGFGRSDFIKYVLESYPSSKKITNETKEINIGYSKTGKDIIEYLLWNEYSTMVYTAAIAAVVYKNIDILYAIYQGEDSKSSKATSSCAEKDINFILLTNFFDLIISSSFSSDMLPFNLDVDELNTSFFNHNLVNYLKKILKYKLKLNICKSIYRNIISYWIICFLHSLPCECSGIFHKNRAWNNPPGR
jgi:hypothetical protein